MAAPLTISDLRRSLPEIRGRLLERMTVGGRTAPAALDDVYLAMYGAERGTQDRITFKACCAPLARRIATERAIPSEPFGPLQVTAGELHAWMGWLQRYDALGAHIIDLYCFAGFGVKSISAVVGFAPRVVVRELRKQQEHLSIRI